MQSKPAKPAKSAKPAISPARRAAFDVLRRVEAEGAYSSPLVAALSESDLSREDRSLAQEITLGVLRWQKSLDYFIERYSRRKAASLDLPVLIALRTGLYQLRHLTRIPASAAVNESVNIVKRSRARSAHGFVNAVLRNAARHMDDTAGDGIDTEIERVSVELSHPQWLIEQWTAQLGAVEARELAAANNRHPQTAFRVNTLATSESDALQLLESRGVALLRSPYIPGAFIVESGSALEVQQAVARGLIYLQDEASQLVSQLLDAKSSERVLDLCAAPGSKSSHIAALTENGALIVACDIHQHRLAQLAATCNRLGATSVAPVVLDATGELPFLAEARRFDRVLIDAPCSGTGTLRRNPEIKWRLAPDGPARLAELQLGLLNRATDVISKRGRLVYSTCSIEVEENESVINRFIDNGAPFRIVRPDAHRDLITAEGFVRTFPHRHETDGFFAAVLERL
jgi:16S rRNA (cytosine967-C5)-methyltransferase